MKTKTKILLGTIGTLLVLACNAPTQPDGGNTKSQSPEAVAGGAAPSNYVRVNHFVGTEKPTYENVDRNRPGKRFERIATRPTPPRAGTGAVTTVAMPLRCTIWYVDQGKAWVIDHQEGEKTFAVSCKMTPQLFTSETKKPGKDIPPECKCTPGNNNIVLVVEWDHE